MTRLPPEDLRIICARDHSLWSEFEGARLFITGGTGFFGRWLVESCLYARNKLGLDVEITLLSRAPEQAMLRLPHWRHLNGLNWITGDVRSFEFPRPNFTHIIHAATDSNANAQREKIGLLETINIGTQRVLELAARSQTQHFLYISSGAAYGKRCKPAHLSEDLPSALESSDLSATYDISKLFAEHQGFIYAERFGFSFKVARCFAFVGPALPINAHFAIGNFIRDALLSEYIVVNGDGLASRSYLYAGDLAIWLYSILSRGTNGEIYNVGSDDAITIRSLAQKVRDLISPNKKVAVMQPPSPGKPNAYLPDINKCRSSLGLQPWTSLDEGIEKTAAWTKSDFLHAFPSPKEHNAGTAFSPAQLF